MKRTDALAPRVWPVIIAIALAIAAGGLGPVIGTAPAALAIIDPCDPSDPNCEPPPVGSITVTKTGFPFRGTVTSSPPGIDCGTLCSAEFAVETVTLTAAPQSGWDFAGWTGCASASGPQCTVTISAGDTPIGARFDDLRAPSVTLASPTGGTYGRYVWMSASASDTGSGIWTIEFRANGAVIRIGLGAYHAFMWDASGHDGAVTVTATAMDNVGRLAADGRTITLDTTVPNATLTAPVADTVIGAPTAVSAVASDSGSGVSTVGFWVSDGATRTTETWASQFIVDGAAPYGGTFDPAIVPGEGTVYLHLWVHDQVGNSVETPRTRIVVDRTAPSLDITEPATGAVITGAAVELSASASDANGAPSIEWAYQDEPGGIFHAIPSTTWDVSALADGPYTIRARARDAAGLETTRTADVTIDHVAPASSLGTLPLAVVSRSFPVSWIASDAGTGVSDYDVYYRSASSSASSFGLWAAWQMATTATSASFTGTPGTSYCFKARARDAAGHRGAWSAPVCTAVPVDDRALTAAPASAWLRNATSAPDVRYFEGTYSRTTRSGATLTRSGIKAKRIALVVTRCATCGSVQVLWNGTAVRTVALTTSGAAKYRQLITVLTFSTVQSGTLTLKQVTNGKPVTIDGVAVSKT